MDKPEVNGIEQVAALEEADDDSLNMLSICINDAKMNNVSVTSSNLDLPQVDLFDTSMTALTSEPARLADKRNMAAPALLIERPILDLTNPSFTPKQSSHPQSENKRNMAAPALLIERPILDLTNPTFTPKHR